MAIWDDALKEVKTVSLSADTYKCPGCASNLLFNQRNGQLECSYCKGKYYPEYFEISNNLNLDDEEEISENDFLTKQEITCNSCGSTIVADKNTSATFCPFCGSPALVTGRLTRSFKPDYIIPFKLTHKEAADIFVNWAGEKKFVPKDFTSAGTLEKITGLYVPFWLIDADCEINFIGGASKSDKDALYQYSIVRKGGFKMHRVPFDGSKRINDWLMECIEPFDYSEMVPFSNGYLPGYFAEKYDLTAGDMAERISNRFRGYMADERDTYMSTDRYETYTVDEDKSKSTNYVCKYALLPVWFLTYKYENIYYRVVINGQTGKITGQIPTDSKLFKRAKTKKYVKKYSALIIALLGFSISFMGTIYYSGYYNGNFAFGLRLAGFHFLGATIFGIWLSFLLRKNSDLSAQGIAEYIHDKNQEINLELERTHDTPPPGYIYIDSRDRVSLIKEDKAIGVFPKALGGEQNIF